MPWAIHTCSLDFLRPSRPTWLQPFYLSLDLCAGILGVFPCFVEVFLFARWRAYLRTSHLSREGVPPGKAGNPTRLPGKGPAALGMWFHLLHESAPTCCVRQVHPDPCGISSLCPSLGAGRTPTCSVGNTASLWRSPTCSRKQGHLLGRGESSRGWECSHHWRMILPGVTAHRGASYQHCTVGPGVGLAPPACPEGPRETTRAMRVLCGRDRA